jgi:hypothetical protein
MGDLLARYDGVEAVLGDVAVATEITGRLHRPKDDGKAWCGATSDAEYVEVGVALEYGADLCQRCYRPALAHLARMSSSPVEDRHGSPEAPSEVSTDVSELEEPTSARPVDAITPEVLVAVGGADTYHAPSADGEAVCGEGVDTTRRRVDQTPPAARPCSRCFTAEVVSEYAGRDADEREAVEAIAGE